MTKYLLVLFSLIEMGRALSAFFFGLDMLKHNNTQNKHEISNEMHERKSEDKRQPDFSRGIKVLATYTPLHV